MSADIESWPERAELERWLMNTVKDPDPGALFLRQVLQMNPAYGGYLQTDKDLAQIVQLTAKRLRARMMSSSGPLSPSSFYEPLCEMTWRITGHLLHAVLVLDSTAANSLPVPKEPLGQVKMLVQTNMELSKKLNMMRRDYLRELTSHRDKQRTISDEANGVLEDLQENPVMFFEPLKFVLDDVTKEFIKLVVEERVKLDQKGAPVPKPAERKPTRELTNPKAKTSEKERALQDELNKVRNELAKLQESFKESEIQVRRLDAAEKSVREQLERSEEQRSNAARKATAQSKAQEEELRLLQQQLEEKDRAMDQLKALGSMEEKSQMEALAQRTTELSEAKASIAELTSQLAKFKEELSSSQQQLKEAEEMRLVAEALAKEAKSKAPQVVEVKEDKSEALAEELGEALEAAKTLRKEKGQLEKALEEARTAQANLQAQLAKQEASPKAEVKKKEEEVKPPTPRAPKVEVVKEEPAPLPPKEEIQPPSVVEAPGSAVNEDLEIWKEKCANLEDEKVDLENQIADLTQQVKILTEKLQEVGGEQAILEVQEKIKLATPRPRKKKKPKRAYERLWQDAQRRIIAMRVQAKVLEKTQEQQIVAWRKNAVTNENSMKIIESLSRMHHDASTSQTALSQAMEDYSIENAPEQEMHDVWDDDEEADDSPASAAGAKCNFSETEEGTEFNEVDEVEVLRTELLHRQQELRALKQEVAVLRRTLETSDGESSQAHRDTSHSRASLKPFMAGDGSTSRYVPPHERPLPKGERYDPSQAGGSNYLQQLQQMQQSSKDASAKDSSKDSSGPRPSIMKFKRAVDLIRKSKPDVRASLSSDSRPLTAALDKNHRPFSSSISVASLGAEISASTPLPAASSAALSGSASAPLTRLRQSVKKVQGNLRESLARSRPSSSPATPAEPDRAEPTSTRDAQPSSRPTSVASGEPTQLFPLTLTESAKPPARHPPSPRPELGVELAEDLQQATTASAEPGVAVPDARPESRTTSISSSALPQELQSLMTVELPELLEQTSREGSKKETPTPPQEFSSREGSKNSRTLPEPEELEEAHARPSPADGATEPPAVDVVDQGSAAFPPGAAAAIPPPSGASLSGSRQPSKNSNLSPRPASQSRATSKNSLGAPGASQSSRQPSKNSQSPAPPSREASKTSAAAAPAAPPIAATQREPSKSEIITPPAVAPAREASKNNAASPTPGVPSQAREASKSTRQTSPSRASQSGSREPSKNMSPPGPASHGSREPSKNGIPSPGVASHAREPSKNSVPSPGRASSGSREPSKNVMSSPAVPSSQAGSREASKSQVPPGMTSQTRDASKNSGPSHSKSTVTTGLTEVSQLEMAPNLATVLSYKPEMPAAKREGSPLPQQRPRARTASASVSPERSHAGREADGFQTEARQPSRDDSGRRPATVPNRELGAGNVGFFIGEAPNLDVRHKAFPKPSKEVPVGHACTEQLAVGRGTVRGQVRPLGSRCKTSPTLPCIQADFGGGHLLLQGEGTPTNNFPIRTRSSRDRFGSDEWDPAPVKPRAKGLMVTAMRSQEWMSQVASEPGDE